MMVIGVSLPTPLAWIGMREEGINKGGAQSNSTGNTDNDCMRPRAAGVGGEVGAGLGRQRGVEGKEGCVKRVLQPVLRIVSLCY